jgi:hypothetical protein
MNDLMAVALAATGSATDAFWIFVAHLARLNGNFKKDERAMLRQFATLRAILRAFDLELARHIGGGGRGGGVDACRVESVHFDAVLLLSLGSVSFQARVYVRWRHAVLGGAALITKRIDSFRRCGRTLAPTSRCTAMRRS